MRFVSDNQGVTIGILVTVLCLLAAGFAVYLKRKTLIRLLFTDKKLAIAKLRYAGLGHLLKKWWLKGCATNYSHLVFFSKEESGFLDSKTSILGFLISVPFTFPSNYVPLIT